MAEPAKIHRDIHWGDKGDDVLQLQRTLNSVAHRFDQLVHFHLTEDGEAGKYTFAAAHRAAFITGLPQKRLDEIAGRPRPDTKRVITERTQNLLRNPEERSDAEKKVAAQRREADRKKHQAARQRAQDAADAGHLVPYDGHMIPSWMKPINDRARTSGSWGGVVISGFRDPAYSEHLCFVMCGAPTCPGRCAGIYSAHSCPPTHTGIEFEGAEDVTDPAGLEAHCRSHGEPLYGNGYSLPNDLNHFSKDGH